MLSKGELKNILFLLNRVKLEASEAATFVELVKKLKAMFDKQEVTHAKEERGKKGSTEEGKEEGKR